VLFNSFQFVVFLIPVLPLFWLLKGRARTYFLLASSAFFYGSWDYRFLSLIFISSLIDYIAGLRIHASEDPRQRRLFLLLSLSANLGILGFFKYFNFFVENLVLLLRTVGVTADLGTLHIILPVGISFYTFQSMSYTIDVYRRRTVPTKDFILFATYVGYFPQLVAGPIERFDRLFPQLAESKPPSVEYLRRAVFLLLQGYFKKVVVADGLAAAVEAAFGKPGMISSGVALEGAILFTCQIFCDFSGYSDIARGVSYLFGVELTENFRAPFLSRSITEFWRRWHVSLSQWLRDYLYISLGGNRRGAARTYVNLMLTMLLGGLWHGAEWKFVIWGGLHGGLLALERRFIFRGSSRDMPVPTWRTWPRDLVLQAITFAAVVFIFVFFRATDLTSALALIGRVADFDRLGEVFTGRLGLALGAILALDLPVFLTDDQHWALRLPLLLRVLLYTLLLLAIIVLSGHQNETFIYFAF